MRVGVLASGSGTILQAMLDRQTPDRRRGRRPAVRRARHRPRTRYRGRARRAHRLRPELRPCRVHHTTSSTRSSATTSISSRSPGSARSCRSRSSTRSAAARVNTHPALLPAFKGWHAVRDALAVGREGHGLHRAPRHRRRRLRADPRPGGGAGARRRHRGDPARAHQGGRAPLVSRRDRTAREGES